MNWLAKLPFASQTDYARAVGNVLTGLERKISGRSCRLAPERPADAASPLRGAKIRPEM
jgi:hypothetical protein